MTFRLTYSFLTFALVVSGACASTHASGSGTAGAKPDAFVDMRRAVRDCREGRLARAELMQTHARYQQSLDEEGDRLREAANRLETLRAQGEDVSERQRVLEQAKTALRAKYEQLQQRLTAAEQKRADAIRARLTALLPQLAAAHKVGPIAEAPPPDASSALDLTDELIRATETLPAAAP